MKSGLLLFSPFSFSAFNVLLAERPTYIQTTDGAIVFMDPFLTGAPKALKPEVVSDNTPEVNWALSSKTIPDYQLLF